MVNIPSNIQAQRFRTQQKGATAQCGMTGQGSPSQEVLSPHLMTTYRRKVQKAGYLIHINPHVGRLSSQSKADATVSPRTIPGIIHLSA
jgi:hypothetical protein